MVIANNYQFLSSQEAHTLCCANISIVTFDPHNRRRGRYYYPYFIHEKTETPKALVPKGKYLASEQLCQILTLGF